MHNEWSTSIMTFIIGVVLGMGGFSLLESPSDNSYQIIEPTMKDSLYIAPMVINKRTGQTWRYYKTFKDNDVNSTPLDEGWIPLVYKFSDNQSFADTPDIAYRNYFNTKEAKSLKVKEYLTSDEDLKERIRHSILSIFYKQS